MGAATALGTGSASMRRCPMAECYCDKLDEDEGECGVCQAALLSSEVLLPRALFTNAEQA